MTQLSRIKAILEDEGKIDNYRCIRERITLRLAARINDLRRAGWDIETIVERTNTIYVLINRPPATPQTLF